MNKLVALLIMTFVLGGCVSITPLQIRPHEGGVVAVNPGFKSISDPKVRFEAMQVMESNCGIGKVAIIEEGYVKVGEETSVHRHGSSDTKGKSKSKDKGYIPGFNGVKAKGKKKSHSHTDKLENITERTYEIQQWQIRYKCL